MSRPIRRARVAAFALACVAAVGTTALLADPASAHQPRPCPAPKGQSGDGSQIRVDGNLTKRDDACRKSPPKPGAKNKKKSKNKKDKKTTTTTAAGRH